MHRQDTGREYPGDWGRLPSAIRPNPSAMDGHTFVVIAHGKDGEVAYRGREAHLSYGAAWREAQIVARRRGLTDVHIVKDGQHIVGEIKARKNPSKPKAVVSDFLFAVNKAIIDAFRRGTGDIKEARAFMVSAASWSESAGSVFRRGSLTKAEQHGKKAADAAWAAGSYDERLGEDIEAALRGLGENKLRPNPVKTFFCFPCGRRFIATGRAMEANCPDCHRVCRETKMKHRSNPRRRARRGR